MSWDWKGDVTPTHDLALTPPASLADLDDDGVYDFILTDGNEVITSGLSTTDPAAAGEAAWDAVAAWRNWDCSFDVVVGNKTVGYLGGIADVVLRPQHVYIGKDKGAVGELILNDAEINNDRDSLPYWVRRAIAWAKSPSYDPYDVVYADLGDEANHPATAGSWVKTPQPAGNYDFVVGHRGSGKAYIQGGALVEVRHQLIIGGYYDGATLTTGQGGDLFIDGATVLCYSKLLEDLEDPDTVTTAEPSQVLGGSAILLRSGRLGAHAGLVNRGGILTAGVNSVGVGGDGLISEIELGSWEVGETTVNGVLANEGFIRVRAGSTLRVNGAIENDGRIYIEAGANLIATDLTGTGLVDCEGCGAKAITLLGGVPQWTAKEPHTFD